MIPSRIVKVMLWADYRPDWQDGPRWIPGHCFVRFYRRDGRRRVYDLTEPSWARLRIFLNRMADASMPREYIQDPAHPNAQE
jgi:hypothetical protein